MSNPNKAKGSNFESRVVREATKRGLEARKQPGSGIYKDFPNDVVIENTLVECKAGYTSLNVAGERFFRLDLEWMKKVERHAQESGFNSHVLIFRPDGSPKCYALVDMAHYLDLLKKGTK